MEHEWIGIALDCSFLFGMIIKNCGWSSMGKIYNDEWCSESKEKKIMYKVYILGKIVKLDERCFRSKL